MQRLLRWLTSLTFAFAVAACGGGSSSSGSGGNPPSGGGPLAGDAASRAVAAMVNVAAQPAAEADIDNGLILIR